MHGAFLVGVELGDAVCQVPIGLQLFDPNAGQVASGEGALVVVALIDVTAFADLETAIEALRAGASDMLLKPFRVTQLLNAFKQSMERTRLKRENWVLKRALSQRTPQADGLVGNSIVIRGLQEALRRVAVVPSTVLLTGESGTGKELAALALHRLGPQANGLFVKCLSNIVMRTLLQN